MKNKELIEKLQQFDPNLEVEMNVDYSREFIDKVEVVPLPDGCPCCPLVDTVVLS